MVNKPDDKNVVAVEVVDPPGVTFVKDYKVIEKSYTQSVKKSDVGEFVVPGKLEGHQGKKHQEPVKKEISAEDRMKQKQKNIFKNYDVILSLPTWVSVKLAMNQPEKVEAALEENLEPEPVGKQPPKGKKK